MVFVSQGLVSSFCSGEGLVSWPENIVSKEVDRKDYVKGSTTYDGIFFKVLVLIVIVAFEMG